MSHQTIGVNTNAREEALKLKNTNDVGASAMHAGPGTLRYADRSPLAFSSTKLHGDDNLISASPFE